MKTTEFLEMIFGDHEGYLFISEKSDSASKEIDLHKPFIYPDQLATIDKYVSLREDVDLYFSPMLYKTPRRKAIMVSHTPAVFADTDGFPIEDYLVAPSVNVESSPGKHASFWILDDDYEPGEVSMVSKAIAMAHASKDASGEQAGTDTGGWDLSQLLRLPNSKNLKFMVPEYGPAKGYDVPYDVTVSDVGSGEIYSLEDLADAYSPENMPAKVVTLGADIPEDLPKSVDVLRRVTNSPKLSQLYSEEVPNGMDWSDRLYYFVSELARAGFTPEEALVAAWHAKCNKYRRDNRPMEDLWQYDITNAFSDPLNRPRTKVDREAVDDAPRTVPVLDDSARTAEIEAKLLTASEQILLTRTFVDRYSDWATARTDAPRAYHVASAFTAMSLVLSEWGRQAVEYDVDGGLGLNLFFVVMGETTDTRKTTARRMLKKLIRSCERGEYQYILTSDVTPEALIDVLAERERYQSALYDRDEAQQLLEDIKGGKQYLKGFKETLNELYDGLARGRTRTTKKTEETPVNFVQYLMGIRSQIQENLEMRDFTSGWGPRNIYVRGESPPRTRENSRLRQRPLNRESVDSAFFSLVEELDEMRALWVSAAGSNRETPVEIEFEETAWERLIDHEWNMKDYIQGHAREDVLKACVTRLAINTIKVATLFAMMSGRQVGTMEDALNAIYYSVQWMEDLILMVEGTAETLNQRYLDDLEKYVIENNGLVTYAKALKWATNSMGLKRKEFMELVDTLVDSDILEVVTDKAEKKSLELAYA